MYLNGEAFWLQNKEELRRLINKWKMEHLPIILFCLFKLNYVRIIEITNGSMIRKHSKNIGSDLTESTGKRTSCAPFRAASSIALRAWTMFLSLSGVTDNWQRAILNYKNSPKRSEPCRSRAEGGGEDIKERPHLGDARSR